MMEEYLKTYDFLKEKIQFIYDRNGNKIINKIFNYGDRNIVDDALFKKYNELVIFSESQKLFLKSRGFLRDEAYFYFSENETVDAYGGMQYGTTPSDDLPIVVISKGLFERLGKYCDSISPRLTKIIKKKMHLVVKGKIDVEGILGNLSLSDFLFLIGRDFIFNHEIAHVIQCEEKPRPVGDVKLNSENTSGASEEDFSEEHHIKELDADQFAARTMCKNLLNYFSKLPIEKQTRQNLADLMAFGLLGIYILFHILSNEMKSKFFFKNTKHPHQSIRMQAIIQTVNGTFVLNMPSGYIFNKHRMTSIFSNLSVQVTGSVENFVAHIKPKNISAQRQKDISNYLDEMMQKTMELNWTLTKREIG